MTWRVRCGEPRARSALCEPRRAFSSGARNVGGSGRASRDAHPARRALASSERCTRSRASCKLRTGGCARPLPPTLEVPVLKRPLNSARSQLLAHRARTLRAQPTLAEAKLWFALAGSKDFLAPSCRLVVEVDGGYHAESPRADSRRTCELERLGYRVIRFPNEHVLHQLGAVLEEIRRAIA